MTTAHPYPADITFDGGDLDCGNGLLLLIRQHMDTLSSGGLLEIRSTETSVDEDLPAWCRMTGNDLVSAYRTEGRQRHFLVCKGHFDAQARQGTSGQTPPPPQGAPRFAVEAVVAWGPMPSPSPAPAIAPLSVMGIGSWPRPRWMLQAIHERRASRLSEAQFEETARDAVRLAVEAQRRGGVDVFTDGEQRREAYASFVAGRLTNCQAIPLTDLLPLVDDPEALRAQMESVDVDASLVRHPVARGPLGRKAPLAVHEIEFLRSLTTAPTKVSLPGPYLLVRLLWIDCLLEKAYPDRESLAADVVRILREEIHDLLAAGASLVQLDEPVLTEVALAGATKGPRFMCGALAERGAVPEELAFARSLVRQVVSGLPPERIGLHVCRGNWSNDESVALSGDYRPLVPTLSELGVGTLFLEACTPRSGELDVLADLPQSMRVGIGVVDQKQSLVETVDDVARRIERAARVLGAHRLLLTPDCGFATFADSPLAPSDVAVAKLSAVAAAVRRFKGE